MRSSVLATCSLAVLLLAGCGGPSPAPEPAAPTSSVAPVSVPTTAPAVAPNATVAPTASPTTQAETEATGEQAPTGDSDAPAAAEPTGSLDEDGCAPGTSFDNFADQCLTPEQSAATLQGEIDANAGPHVDGAPGCADRARSAGAFNPSCAEYQGYLDPGGPGRAPTSGELQTQFGCQQGYITGPVCANDPED